MALRDQPYIPLYVQDFLTDEKLAECSAESTGVYIRIMCLMHKSETYGKILLKQKHKQTDKQIKNFALLFQKHLPYSADVIERSIQELVDEGVLIIDGDFLIQKRMVKDNELSIKRALSGKKGGEKSLGKDSRFAQASAQAKSEANSENEYEDETEYEDEIKGVSTDVQRPFNECSTKKRKEKKGNENKEKETSIYPFEEFWNDYDKKVGDKDKIQKKWNNVSDDDRKLIKEYLPKYKLAQPDKKFRKNPDTFLNNKSWNDEIIDSKPIQKPAYQPVKNVNDKWRD